MAGKIQEHETSISVVKPAPAEVDAGSEMALNISVSCASACDLRGEIVEIIAQDEAVIGEIELAEFDEKGNETGEFVVKAPTAPGSYTWSAIFRAQEQKGVLHKARSAPFSFTVKPHVTSIAIWDVPSPIVLNNKFKFKVGVSCSLDCKLTDGKIEIYDQEGRQVATEKLGRVPWQGTNALYWTEVELESPCTEGRYTWQAKFPKPDSEPAHEAACFSFGFITARPPEHQVTVEVIDKDKNTPIENAYVLLSPYRNYSGDGGVAKIGVAKGEYELNVAKADYKPFQTIINVATDMAVKAELVYAPVKDNGR